MEADMAQELFTRNDLFELLNVYGARLIMDDDTTCLAGLRQLCPYEIEKWNDINHSSKGFKNGLYGLQLPKPLIEYFCKNFLTVIHQNKGNKLGMEQGFKALIPHAFGDHSNCTFHDNKEEYDYKNLPDKKPLTNENLKVSLQDLVNRFIENVDKLVPNASTQKNESFNNTMASKCPKSRFFQVQIV